MKNTELLNDTKNLEKGFLGGFYLCEEELQTEIFEKLKPEDFSTLIHQEIYNGFIKLYEERKEFDPTLLMKVVMSNNPKIREDSLNQALFEILDETSSYGIAEKADLIIERAKFRKLKDLAKRIDGLSENFTINPDEAFEEALMLLDKAMKGNDKTKLINLQQYTIEQIKLDDERERVEETNTQMGYLTNFTEFDNKLNGLNKSDLIIIAGRPAMGKTAFALNILMNFGKANENVRALYVSLEMGINQLYTRILAMESGINAQSLKRKDVAEYEFEKLYDGYKGIMETSTVEILDKANVNISELRNIATKYKKNNGLDLIIIDYLQLLSGSDKNSKNRQEEVSEISRKLKQLARELNIPIIALSQLSRSVESRADKRPLLSDLRESGAIEQDADIVIFLYRDEYYNPTTSDLGMAEVIIAKHRNGAVGTIKLKFEPHLTKFSNTITF